MGELIIVTCPTFMELGVMFFKRSVTLHVE